MVCWERPVTFGHGSLPDIITSKVNNTFSRRQGRKQLAGIDLTGRSDRLDPGCSTDARTSLDAPLGKSAWRSFASLTIAVQAGKADTCRIL